MVEMMKSVVGKLMVIFYSEFKDFGCCDVNGKVIFEKYEEVINVVIINSCLGN